MIPWSVSSRVIDVFCCLWQVSTPGTTTNSDDADVTVSHLAEAEHAFSEASAPITTPDSSLASPPGETDDAPGEGSTAEVSSGSELDSPPGEAGGDRAMGVDIVIVPAEEVVIEPVAEQSEAGASSGHKPEDPLLQRGGEEEDVEGALVYVEREADTSCVLLVEEPDADNVSNGSGVSGIYDNVHDMC